MLLCDNTRIETDFARSFVRFNVFFCTILAYCTVFTIIDTISIIEYLINVSNYKNKHT